jgi:16S rRNA (uracil1498-N3)-methyltransferase
MTRRRWIADEFSGTRAALTGAHAAHLSRTLRARVGQQFEVACGEQVRRATVSSVQDERVEFALGEEVMARESVPITLLLAVFKFDRMEWAIEKCTELNVTTIVPVIARRTEKHLALAADKRVERWRRIAREAAEQSRRIAPPEIADPVKLKEALANFHDSVVIPSEGLSPSSGIRVRRVCDLRIVLAETESEAPLSDVLRARDHVTSLALAIGPEGGWTTDELQLFELSHWVAASLGDTILRAETAAISAVAIARAGC